MFVAVGEQFHPVLSLASTNYVTVWFLEFWLDRYIREEKEEGNPVSDKLKLLHNDASMEEIEAHVGMGKETETKL